MAPAVWFDKQGGTSRCLVFSPSRLCSVGESFASSSRWFGHWRRGADLTVIILIIMSSLSFRNWIKKSYLSLWASVMNTQQVRWKMFWFWCEIDFLCSLPRDRQWQRVLKLPTPQDLTSTTHKNKMKVRMKKWSVTSADPGPTEPGRRVFQSLSSATVCLCAISCTGNYERYRRTSTTMVVTHRCSAHFQYC